MNIHQRPARNCSQHCSRFQRRKCQPRQKLPGEHDSSTSETSSWEPYKYWLAVLNRVSAGFFCSGPASSDVLQLINLSPQPTKLLVWTHVGGFIPAVVSAKNRKDGSGRRTLRSRTRSRGRRALSFLRTEWSRMWCYIQMTGMRVFL